VLTAETPSLTGSRNRIWVAGFAALGLIVAAAIAIGAFSSTGADRSAPVGRIRPPVRVDNSAGAATAGDPAAIEPSSHRVASRGDVGLSYQAKYPTTLPRAGLIEYIDRPEPSGVPSLAKYDTTFYRAMYAPAGWNPMTQGLTSLLANGGIWVQGSAPIAGSAAPPPGMTEYSIIDPTPADPVNGHPAQAGVFKPGWGRVVGDTVLSWQETVNGVQVEFTVRGPYPVTVLHKVADSMKAG
jgi:hypothetical protein